MTMLRRIGPHIQLQYNNIMLIDGGGGVFMVYGLDRGHRYLILVMFCVKVEVGVE